MKTSVVIATYNGEKFIKKQLESILNQTEKVDEVIIQDDCSNDATVSICRDFLKDNNLNWEVIQNDSNKGFKNNFISALKKATGEIIFLCDQDDIWKENKVEAMKEYMKNTQILSLATTVDLIDENDQVYLKHLKHPNIKKNGIKQIGAKQFFRFFDYLGMTMAIRKELIKHLEENDDDISHDVLINYFAMKENGFFFLDKSLTLRRSFNNNLSFKESKEETEKNFSGNERARSIAHRSKYLRIINQRYDTNYNIEKVITTNDDRVEYLTNRKFTGLIKKAPTVISTYGFGTFVKDGINIIKQ